MEKPSRDPELDRSAACPEVDFQKVFEALPGRYLILRPNLTIAAVSDRYLEATLTRREEILGRGIFDVFTDDVSNRARTGVRNLSASLERVLKTKGPDRMPVQRYDILRPSYLGGGYEERYWSPINSPVLGAHGEMIYIVHRVEDVTDYWLMRLRSTNPPPPVLGEEGTAGAEIYRNAEAICAVNDALRESEERVRVALLNAPIFLYTLDRDLRFNWVASPPRHLCWAMIGRRDDELLPAEVAARLMAFKRRVLETGRGDRTEIPVPLEGETMHFDFTAEPLRNGAGDIVGLTIAAVDVSERKRNEAAITRLVEELEVERARLEKALAERTELLGRIVSSQEHERQRIAREIHDRLGQYLTSLGLALGALDRTSGDGHPADGHITELKTLTAAVGQEISRVAWDMRPVALDRFGLHEALTDYLEEWSDRTGIQTDYHDGLRGEKLAETLETTLYRILQEALTNIAKHAHASRVSVILDRVGTDIRLLIEDDGRGFDVAQATTAPLRRLGLVGVRERLALVGGVLEIESGPDQGTTLYARLPG